MTTTRGTLLQVRWRDAVLRRRGPTTRTVTTTTTAQAVDVRVTIVATLTDITPDRIHQMLIVMSATLVMSGIVVEIVSQVNKCCQKSLTESTATYVHFCRSLIMQHDTTGGILATKLLTWLIVFRASLEICCGTREIPASTRLSNCPSG